MSHVEYLIEKSGLDKVAYFIASREEGGEWVAGLFPAYMSPEPSEEGDDGIFDLAHPEHVVTGATREAAENRLREWIEETFRGKIHERRSERRFSE